MNERKVISPSDLAKYNVNRPGAQEANWQPQYDYQVYASAGQSSLSFFQVPQGQSGKTIADTNMEQAGTFPQPKRFLIQGIEIHFESGVLPGLFGAQAAADYWNDVAAVAHGGHFQLFIGSKPYLDEAPLGVFPTTWRIGGVGALSDTTTAAAAQQSKIDYAKTVGPTYAITPILIPTQQNFRVDIDWPTPVALPSGVNGRIGVRLLGTLYRLSQ